MLASKSLGALSFVSPAWNVANAEFLGTPVNSFYVGVQDLSPRGLFFKPDGTKMYTLGNNTNRVYEYNLSTAWNISTAVLSQSFSTRPQDTNSNSVSFSSDGISMYMLGHNNDRVNQYTLSTAWDISTAVFTRLFSVAAQDLNPQGLAFKSDGTKMYIVGQTTANIYEYDLSTAWDISTTTFVQTLSVTAQDTSPNDVFFKPDGTKMYVSGESGKDINEYDLSTAWNISTAVFLQSFLVSTKDTAPVGVFFKDDGTVMYVMGNISDTIYQYQLSTAWNVSTATYSQPTTKYFSVAAQDTSPQDVFFKPDGLKMYVFGNFNDRVYEYDLSSAWAVSTAIYLQNFFVGTQEGVPQGLFFKPDGTKMYIVGSNGDEVNEYNLSIAWDISTAVFLQLFSVAAQDIEPRSLFFKSDGIKMYVLGLANDRVYEYDLSTAWDISTSVFLQFFGVNSQEANPEGLFFKPDGTKMYVAGSVGDDVNEYELSTAWDISTATFVRLFSVAALGLDPTGVFFRNDGLKMYIIYQFADNIAEYDLV